MFVLLYVAKFQSFYIKHIMSSVKKKKKLPKIET